MILMDEDDKDHNVHPYKDRQNDLIKKHFTNECASGRTVYAGSFN